MSALLNRRDLLAALSAGASGLALPTAATPARTASSGSPAAGPGQERSEWRALLERIVAPVLSHLSAGRLRAAMPVEKAAGYRLHPDATYVEAVGRSYAGIAPWLALPDGDSEEAVARARRREQALQGLVHAFDPASPDRLNFAAQSQPIVDAAFLAHAFLRAPDALWRPLDARTRARIVSAFASLRDRPLPYNNWLLFGAMTETFLRTVEASWDPVRVDFALRKFDEWYLGDGWYGDGPGFAFDYYNAFVIHPMLVDVLQAHARFDPDAYAGRHARALERMQRYGTQQERMISPEGTYPPIGRSITYRSGAFQALAQLALMERLPEGLAPGQVRAALGAVKRRVYGHPHTFDADGWLRLGLVGHQPEVADYYSSTGSLYMATLSFLPLGLPADHAFWTAPTQDWTARRAWSGVAFRKDYRVDG